MEHRMPPSAWQRPCFYGSVLTRTVRTPLPLPRLRTQSRLPVVRASGHRHRYTRGRPSTGRALILQDASEGLQPLAHADDAER